MRVSIIPKEASYPSPPTQTDHVVARLKHAHKVGKETDALRALVKRMVELFKDDQRPSYYREASILSEITAADEYQILIFAFSRAITSGTADASAIDLDLLGWFARCLRQSKERIPREAVARLGAVLGGLSKHMNNAQNFADLQTQYSLVRTIGTVLDAMVDVKFSGIDRESLHTPLTEKLRDLKNGSEPRISQAAHYAFQALQRIPDNEGPWEAFFRYSGTAIDAVAKISSGVATMDPKKFVDAAPDIFDICKFFIKVVESGSDFLNANGDIQSLIAGMQDASAQNGWYDALRQTDVLIDSGAYEIMKRLIPGLVCQNEELFWCGLYAQLEQCWVDDKPSKAGALDFIEWTFPLPSLRRVSSKYRSIQEWIKLLAYTFHRPAWRKHLSKPKRTLSLCFRAKGDFKPKLKTCLRSWQPQYDQHFPLLQLAVENCKYARLFYADAALAQYYTRERRLDIERLSGEIAPIDKCYINLALIENAAETKKNQVSEFSLFDRLKIETDLETDVPLVDLFKARSLRDGSKRSPRRILIRGRAGVGKSTLCKKIIHDFLYHQLWTTHFDRALWIPLRKLKDQDTLEQFLRKSFFEKSLDKDVFFPTLWDTLCDQNDNRTLFILDGLDEVIGYQRPEGSFIDSFRQLLNRNNVIITSRPYAVYPSQLEDYDLEIETVGFRDHQIESYVRGAVEEESKVSQIKDFIAQHWLVKGLIRIPIQLDALCFTWDGELAPERIINTMTTLYGAIERKLWHKDMISLEKRAQGRLLTGHTAQKYRTRPQIKKVLSQEIELLELMAFLGIYHNITEFTWTVRSEIYDRTDGLTDDILDRISFIRSSETSPSSTEQNYYFIHLTFQEYFAAQYFVRCWKLGQSLQCLELKPDGDMLVRPEELLDQEKYNGRYDIMWRFAAGLLEAEGEKHLVKFFERIENERRDLLGTMHYRLLMHCFSEVTVSGHNSTLQRVHVNMESQLPGLVLFEGRMGRRQSQFGPALDPPVGQLHSTALLGTEMEFPEQILARFLDEGGVIHPQIALEALTKRSQVSPSVMTRVTSFLDPTHPVELRKAAARIIGNNPEFSVRITKDVINEHRKGISFGALYALRKHPKLPEEILSAIISHLGSPFSSPTEVEVFRNQLSLSDSVVQGLLHQLKDKNPLVRARVVQVLVACSLLQEGMLKDVAALLNDPDDRVQEIIFSAFENQSAVPRPVLDGAISKLGETKSTLSRYKAIKVLEEQNPMPRDVVESMWSKIEHPIADVRDLAFRVLQKEVTPSAETWEEIFNRSMAKDIVAIALTKGCSQSKLALPEKILNHCVSIVMSNGNSLIKAPALRALQENQSLPADILAKLSPHLNDRHQNIRRYVLGVFGNQSKLTNDDATTIACRLRHEGEYIRESILVALRSCSNLPHDVLKQLVPLLASKPPITRRIAVSILSNQEKLPPKILQSLISLLRAQERNTRVGAEKVLRKHANLGDLLPRLDVESWVSLFKAFLERSFNEQVFCSVLENHLCIELPEGSWKIDIDHPEQHRKLLAALEAVRDELKHGLDDSGNAHDSMYPDNDDIIESIAGLF
jgi:hypothetical protein